MEHRNRNSAIFFLLCDDDHNNLLSKKMERPHKLRSERNNLEMVQKWINWFCCLQCIKKTLTHSCHKWGSPSSAALPAAFNGCLWLQENLTALTEHLLFSRHVSLPSCQLLTLSPSTPLLSHAETLSIFVSGVPLLQLHLPTPLIFRAERFNTGLFLTDELRWK